MIATALGFGGRIGRMRYFLLSCGLAFVVTVLIFTLVLVLGPSYAEQANTAEEVIDELIVPLALVVLPIFLWGAAALAAKRFRDIGWKPLYVIPAWALAVAFDTMVALSAPVLAIGEGDKTPLGLTINLVLLGALFFWPGRPPDCDGPDMDALRRPYLDAARPGALPASRQQRPTMPSSPPGFGRRRI